MDSQCAVMSEERRSARVQWISIGIAAAFLGPSI